MIEERKRAGTESMLKPSIMAMSYEEARTRKVAAEAEIAELELARIRGTLCMTTDVVKAWETVLYACKAKLLSTPSKVAPLLANELDVSVIKELLDIQIKEALSELSNYQPSVDPSHTGTTSQSSIDGNEANDTAATPKRSRMGRPRKTAGLAK